LTKSIQIQEQQIHGP